MPTGTTADQSVVNVWKTGSIGVGDSTVSSFRGGAGYGGFTGGTPTGALGVDQNIVDPISAPTEEVQKYSTLLKGAKYLKSATKKYNKALGDALVKARDEWQVDAARTNRPELTFEQFLVENQQKGTGKSRIPTGTVTITTPSSAAALIEARFKAELGRSPSAEEVVKYTKKLNKVESKPSPVKLGTPKMLDGKLLTTYTGGIHKDQLLNDFIRSPAEYKEKAKAATSKTIQELAKTAAANGLDLNKDFGSSIDGWMKQLASGTDIETIKGIIRQSARLGMPDRVATLLDQGVDLETVYAPYKRIMATVLEVNPDTISLNDPTLRGAIGQDKEMTLYDFQRSLRKDPRWQYTDNAREEVSNAALKVLQDFGFQG